MKEKVNKIRKDENVKNNKLDVVFLLDRSGSMYDSVEDTIGGYNSYLNKQKKKNINTRITTVLFDDRYEILHDRKSIKEVKNITNKEYFVRGSTALLDAIGKTIITMDRTIKKDNKVLFIITTDGLENSSYEFSKNDIKKLIEKHKNFEFLYLGANIDSYSEANSIGISKKNVSNYTKSKKGIQKMFDACFAASESISSGNTLDESWKKEI